MVDSIRRSGESMQAYRGRLRRERADAVDALYLKPGEPIIFAGQFARFNPSKHKRADNSYGFIRRPDAKQMKEFERWEKEKIERDEAAKLRMVKRELFEARPVVVQARSVQYLLEQHFEDVVDALTAAEWQSIADRLEQKKKGK